MVALLRTDIAPGHHEHRVPLLDRVLDEGILRLQVEDVVLVDAGRHHDERPDARLGSLRRVLDELRKVVLVHHRARSDREIAPDFERQQICQTARQAFTAALDCIADHLRIGRCKIRGAHRVDPLPRGKPQPVLRRGLELGTFDEILQEARREKIGLADIVVVAVLAPLPAGEAAIAGLRRRHGLGRSCEKSAPQPRLLLEVGCLLRSKSCRVRRKLRNPLGARDSLQAFCKGHPPFDDVVASRSNALDQGLGLRVLGLHRSAHFATHHSSRQSGPAEPPDLWSNYMILSVFYTAASMTARTNAIAAIPSPIKIAWASVSRKCGRRCRPGIRSATAT